MTTRRSDCEGRSTGIVTRRRLLQLALATGAVGVTQPLTRAGIREQAWAGTPREGGTLKMAFADSPRVLDPPLMAQATEYMVTQNIYDNLTRIDEKLQAQPQLATRWSSDEQGRLWTFTLREGVKFHHGRELIAQDIVFTFERILDPKTGSPIRRTLPIEKIEAIDAHTVRFRLPAPFADLPVLLGGHYARILPHDRGDLIKTDPSGTGPFRLVEFRPGDRIRMVRFKDYWDRGRPYLDELWQVNISQHATQVASLTGGDIQMMWEVPVAYIPSLERAAGVSLVEVKSPGFQPITMNSAHKPFDDNRVRLAMKYLVDRPDIIRAIWQGHATVANDHTVPPISPFWAATSPQHTYDVAKAKALLAEAGYPSGFNLELWTSTERAGMQELAVAVQQMVAPAGIKIEIKTVPWAVYVPTVWLKKPFYGDNFVGRATIDETLTPYFRTAGPYNPGLLNNSQLDKLIDEGRSQTDLRKRKEIYAQAQQLISEEGHMVIAYHSNYVTAMSRKVKGYVVHPLRYADFRWTYLES